MSDYEDAVSKGLFTEDRWEAGVEHHPMSLRIADFISKQDKYGEWSWGGDGDNGEELLYQLDPFFELLGMDLEVLQDRLKNGIEYDEEQNQYILVWTKKEIDDAKKRAEELAKFFELPVVEPETDND